MEGLTILIVIIIILIITINFVLKIFRNEKKISKVIKEWIKNIIDAFMGI